MVDPEYSFRLSIRRKEETYRLSADALVRTGRRELRLPFAEIRQVRCYRSPGLGKMARGQDRCVVRPKRGRPIVLSSAHFARLGTFEDRSASFVPFVDALARRVATANPAAELIVGMPPGLWWMWVVLLVLAVIVAPLAGILVVVSLIEGERIGAGVIGALVILLTVLLGLPTYIRALKRGRARRFDPRSENPLASL